MDKLITKKLQQRRSRAVGYRLLICYLKKSNMQLLEINARYWLTKIFESSSSELRLYGDLIFTTLSLLISKMHADVNLSKTFASSYLPKLFEMLSHNGIYNIDSYTIAVLQTIKQCLIYYPKAIKSGKASIEKYLMVLLNNSNSDVMHQSGQCWLLLKNIPGNSCHGSNKGATLWKDYQLSLLKTIHYVINRAFNSPEEIIDNSFAVQSLENFTTDVEKDPFERTPIIFQRIDNLIELLKITLSKPLIKKKYIGTQQILELIQTGFKAKIHQRNNARVDQIYFETYLPEMYIKLLEVLEILIDICNTHLRMDFRIVLNILMDAFEMTKSLLTEGYQSRFGKLRLTVYRVLALWCLTLKEGSHCEIISEAVIKEIINDLVPQPQNSSLAPIKRDKQHLEEIFLMLGVSIGNKNDSLLRQQALFCLQQLLSSSGHMIKTSILKDVHNSLLGISIQIHSKQMTKEDLSTLLYTRLEVYKLLIFLLKSRNNGWIAPVETIISLMGAFRLCDNSIEFRQNSNFEVLEKMLHSHRSNIYFEQRFTDIQFLNVGHENVRLSRIDVQTLSDMYSQRNDNQLPLKQNEEEEQRDNLSQISSKYVLLDSHCSSNADLNKINEPEHNKMGRVNVSLNKPIILGDGFGNGSKLITAKENKIILPPLNNEKVNDEENIKDSCLTFEKNHLKGMENDEISPTSVRNLGNDEILIAELEAAFISELK